MSHLSHQFGNQGNSGSHHWSTGWQSFDYDEPDTRAVKAGRGAPDGSDQRITIFRIAILRTDAERYRTAPISRKQIAFLFWPDSTDMQALKNLLTLHTRLRHALSIFEAAAIISYALTNQATAEDAKRITGHMIEMASTSVEGWLKIKLPPGCYRNQNLLVIKKFGAGGGHNIP